MSDIKTYPDKDALISGATEFVGDAIRESLSQRPGIFVALSGGSTPKPLYERLAEVEGLDWNRIHVCFVDERNVGPDDKDSNYRMVREALLSRIAIPEQQVHRMRGELAAEQAASEYEKDLRSLNIPQVNGWPAFDLMILGMGPDGHTASLFPGTEALQEKSRWVTPNYVPKMSTHRITLTYPVINHARSAAFLVSGADKAQPLAEVLSGASTLPAAGVAPVSGSLVWLLDQAAAERIRRN